ncbi:DeoR/GlpR family DNA-binding transcription regulator [Kineococcus sp. LSe6-4]|uniref:DeoR/GlpR family DNA-binding transcription regulator n=1 Tax=Kineococcus halophytocola TaxID=3234027 RepID=A0ABV4H4U3_9ACTN
MISAERRRRILQAIHHEGATSVRDLAERMAVSQSTIRRDLQVLNKDGELLRTHGGAMAPDRQTTADLARMAGPGAPDATVELPFDLVSPVDRPLKERVAAAAATLVHDGDVVILDIGTTTVLVAEALRGRDITVITSNLAVFDVLRDDDAVRLVLLGGVVRRNYQSLVGSATSQMLSDLNADLVLLSCTGVRNNGRVVDNMAVEEPIKRAMIEAAEKVVLLATETKFPGTGSQRLCSVDDVDVLVTTEGADPVPLQRCRDAGGKVIIT